MLDPSIAPAPARRMTRKMKLWLIAAALIGVFALWLVGTFDKPLSSAGLNAQDCIVLVLGGNKLCGEDARAWCDATDSIREASRNPFLSDPSTTDIDIESSQAMCDAIRGR